jgi:hypothetical protein
VGCGEASGTDESGESDVATVGTQQDALYVRTTKLWPSPRISVCWESDSTGSEHDATRYWVQDALYNTWSAVSSVRFRGWGTCSEGEPGIHVRIRDEIGVSAIGTDGDGDTAGTNVNSWASVGCGLGSREACVRSTAVHEFGHALSFYHEQDRAGIPAGTPPSSGRAVVGDEDLDSAMHYDNPVRNGGGYLSRTDVEGVRLYYGGDGWALSPEAFDVDFYRNLYGDVGSTQEEATLHWLSEGLPRRGRRGNRAFDVTDYLTRHTDLRAAYGNPAGDPTARNSWRFMGATNHWLNIGLPSEGRRGSREFDPGYYRAIWGDLNNAFGDDWRSYAAHYEWWGAQVEGRRASADFDASFYLGLYPDLQNAFGSNNYNAALIHWLQFGIWEGRQGAP